MHQKASDFFDSFSRVYNAVGDNKPPTFDLVLSDIKPCQVKDYYSFTFKVAINKLLPLDKYLPGSIFQLIGFHFNYRVESDLWMFLKSQLFDSVPFDKNSLEVSLKRYLPVTESDGYRYTIRSDVGFNLPSQFVVFNDNFPDQVELYLQQPNCPGYNDEKIFAQQLLFSHAIEGPNSGLFCQDPSDLYAHYFPANVQFVQEDIFLEFEFSFMRMNSVYLERHFCVTQLFTRHSVVKDIFAVFWQMYWTVQFHIGSLTVGNLSYRVLDSSTFNPNKRELDLAQLPTAKRFRW